eukprot:COSAG05_NODE_21879_length_268_cov_1.224852_1_plen_45_part_10
MTTTRRLLHMTQVVKTKTIRPALRRQARAHTHDGALLDWRLPPGV